MKKTFYLQTDNENRVTDILTFPYEDYKAAELETPLPQRILCGCYEFTEGGVIYRREWDTNDFETRLAAQQETIDALLIQSLEA